MTETLQRIPAGLFGDEAGDVRRWDGERWGAAVADADLVPADVRAQRLADQVSAFERAGYRVVRRDDHRAVLTVDAAGRRGPGAFLRRRAAVVESRVVISVDRAGAVRFSR